MLGRNKNIILVSGLLVILLMVQLALLPMMTYSQRNVRRIKNPGIFDISAVPNKRSISSTVEPNFPSQRQNISIEVYRTFNINDYLYVILNETIKIKNEDERSFNAILIYYPKDFWRKIVYFRVLGAFKEEDLRKIEWRIHTFSKDYIGIAVIFERPIYKGEEYTIILLSDLPNFAWLESPNNDDIYCYLVVYKMPLLPYKLDKARVSIIAPPTGDVQVTFEDIEPKEGKSISGSEVYWVESNVEPFNFSTPYEKLVKIKYFYKLKTIAPEGYTYLPLRFPNAIREIEITTSGKIRVRDEFYIEAITPASNAHNVARDWGTLKLRIGLAENVENIRAYDDFGKLDVTEDKGEGIFENYTFVEVKLRTPVTGNELVKFYVEYTIQPVVKNDTISLSIPLSPIINATMSSYTLRILTPHILSMNLSSCNPELMYNESRWTIERLLIPYMERRLHFSMLIPPMNTLIHLRIDMNKLVLLRAVVIMTPLAIVLVTLTLMITEAVTVKRRRALPEIPRRKRIIATVSQLIKAYEEYIAIENETDQKLIREILGRRPSASTLMDLRNKMEETYKKRETIFMLISKIISQYPEVREYASELRRIEGRLTIIRRMIFEEAEKFLKGEVSKVEYDALIYEYIDAIIHEKTKRVRIVNKLKSIFFAI